MKQSSKGDFYTREEYARAKNVCIVDFLQSIGYELIRSGGCYKGKLHDSLVIQADGRWYWNSFGLHGCSPIELYKHILLKDFGYSDEVAAVISAVKQLAGESGMDTALMIKKEPKSDQPARTLALPAPYHDNRRVLAYLCKTRALDYDIVLSLIKSGQIYETIQIWNAAKRQYEDGKLHNAVFLALDMSGCPRRAFIRGTMSNADKQYKRDLEFSDKSYPFTLPGQTDSDRVFVFESDIDSISHASICKMQGGDWRGDYRISLGGTSFSGLDRFLGERPNITDIVACLDNDATGNRRSEKLMEDYAGKGYSTSRQAPDHKDFNEDLVNIVQEDELEL